MRACLLLLACLWLQCGSAQAALRVVLVEDGLSTVELAASQALVDAALERLPPAWRDEPRTLRLAWRGDLPDDVHGRIRGDRIFLSRGLLDAAQPSHAALSALIHELAHARDRSHGLSRDPRLLDLAGWQVRPLWPGRSRHNAFAARSPDPYELESPAEFVAVNLEHFLLDDGYACRRPALHAWFAAHFGATPAAADCDAALPFVDAAALADPAAEPLLALDPARVAGVDYLLAGPGNAAMSRWGHTMLRLVVCAPGRAPGPECRLDLEHHRVLSFRAFVDDVQLSGWRGLTGGYPSRLFVLPLQQVVDEYTRVELRPLDSVPLRLSPDAIRGLLERAAQVHWSYDGRYRFIGNNCAVETWKLLHDSLPRAAKADLSSVTPRGLLRRLRRAGLVDDGEVPTDPGEALRLGYRFESWSAHHQALYDTARETLPLGPRDVEDWLRLSPGDRAPWLTRADTRAAAALLLLEQAALRREEQRARDAIKRRVFAGPARQVARHADRPGVAGMVRTLQAALREGGVLASPAALLPLDGYGIPQPDEWAPAREGAATRAARVRQLDAELHALGRAWLPRDSRASLEQTEANIALLGARLRALHEAEAGFRLDAAARSPAAGHPPPDGGL